MSDEFASGVTKVSNLSGGVFRSASPSEIPQVSWQDVSNFDIDNGAIKTRRGLTKYGTGLRPGCLQFGFSDTQRVHFNRSWGGDYGPTGGTSGEIWNCFFYARSLGATGGDRNLVTFLQRPNGSGSNLLGEIYFNSSGQLVHRFRETTADGFNTLTQSTGSTVGTATTYLYGVSLAWSGATTMQQTLFNASGSIATQQLTVNSSFDTIDSLNIGVGQDDNLPGTNPTSASNEALYGLMGEIAFTKNVSPTSTTFSSNYQVLPPCYNTATANQIAYYPLTNNFDDKWGNQPTLTPNDVYRFGAGLTHYMVRDNLVPGVAKDPVYCTRSMHVNTYGTRANGHVQGRLSAIDSSSTIEDALNSATAAYTMTMDILPIKCATSTTQANVWETGNSGPTITMAYNSASDVKVKFKHVHDASTQATITTTIPYKKSSKLTFALTRTGSATTGRFNMNIYKDLGKVATTLKTGAGTPTTPSQMLLGSVGSTRDAIEYYVSGIVLHNADVATSWSEKPQENVRQITSYETYIIDEKRRRENILSSLSLGTHSVDESSYTKVSSSTKIERTGQDISFANIMELPQYDSVIGMWLFHDVTGFDTATSSTYHGRLPNLVSSEDNFDLIYNCAPVWVADRVQLTSTGYLDDVYQNNPDRLVDYVPNDSTARDTFTVNNNALTSYTGTTHALDDTYKYTHRLDQKMRGFNYGQSLYLHGVDYNLRYNGLDMIAAQSPHPGVPLTLTAVTNGGVGLRGYYKYAYTFVDKNGYESYPCKPTGTTCSYKKIHVTCNLQVQDESWINECIETVRFYRNKGTTVSSTSLTVDASPELYFLRELPLKTIKDNVGTTWFTDGVSDDALGAQPPLPGFSDQIPPCKYSTLHNDVAYYTGNTYEPTMVYKSSAFKPFLLNNTDEFRTEDGEKCTGISATGQGVIVFKETGRRYYYGGMGNERPKEYINGGCISHDTLVKLGDEVIGLGSHGFFITNGPNYKDITKIIEAGRDITDVQYDINSESQSDMRNAYAVYHEPTSRYLCQIGDKTYVFDLKRRRWMIYRDVIGKMLVRDGSLYYYLQGRFYKEVSNQAYVGTMKFKGTSTDAGLGYVTVTSTTALPLTNEEGLPCYVGKTRYWVRNISDLGSDSYKIELDTNETFTTGGVVALGVIRHYADTKDFEQRTAGRNKQYFGKLTLDHDNATNGEIEIRTKPFGDTFDTSYSHYVADTNENKVETILRVRSESIAIEFEVIDGIAHQLYSYSFPYKQDSIL